MTRSAVTRERPAATELASPSRPPAEPALALLLALPTDVLTLMLLRLSTHDLGRVDQVCHAFHSETEDGAASVVEQALRRRAGGHAPPAELGGEASVAQLLMWLERRRGWPKAQWAICSDRHSTFVDAHGRVLACSETEGSLSSPTALRGVRVVSVAAGHRHTLALTEAGQVYAWGSGHDNRLGHGDSAWFLTPKLVEALRGVRIQGVAAGNAHSVARTDGGRLLEWGCNGVQLAMVPKWQTALQGVDVADVAAGSYFTVAVSSAGRVYSWGVGWQGRLGHGGIDDELSPAPIEALAGVVIADVSCWLGHSVARTDDGRVYSWGHGRHGRLGHGDLDPQYVPKRVEALHGARIVSVAASNFHSLAVTETGEVYSWGGGSTERLAHDGERGRLLPQRVAFPASGGRVKHVAAGDYHSLAVTDAGKVYRWRDSDDATRPTLRLIQGLQL